MKKSWIITAALAFAVLIGAPAHATLTMTIINSSGVEVFSQTGSNDIVSDGQSGLFTTDLQTTGSNASSGNPGQLTTTSLNLTSSSAGFFTVKVLETGFFAAQPNSNGQLNFESIINASRVSAGLTYDAKTLIDGVELLVVEGITSTDSFSATQFMNIGSTYSIAHEFTVRSTAAGQSFAFDMSTQAVTAEAVVPEPGMLGLLGLGFFGLAFVTMRRRRGGSSY